MIACCLLSGAALIGGALPVAVLLGLSSAAVGTYIGLRHPLWLFWLLAVTLAALPFGYFPGVHAPLTFGFGTAVLLASLLHRSHTVTVSALEIAVLALVGVSAVSVAATFQSPTDLAEFGKWTVSTLLVVVLLRLSTTDLTRFGRIYAVASAVAALFAIVIVVGDPNGRLISYLSFVGYGRESNSTRFVYSEAGNTVRLAGTYIDPNTAGIGLVVALAVTLVVFTGWHRVALATLFVVAVALTLSRAAMFSILGGLVVLVLFHTLSSRQRRTIFAALAVAVLAAVATPQVRRRVFSSFGSGDAGSSARADALDNFATVMHGHWLSGLGWGRPEFKEPSKSFEVNYVANAPLLTVYRGGIVTGVIFLTVLLVAAAIAYRTLRSTDTSHAALAGIFIGFTLVALQLDFPVVTIPSVTMMFSVLLVFLARNDPAAHQRVPATRTLAVAAAH
ncbi:O-antigen ligase family protein [Mycobacterium sp. DL592]|uniref:O-antigen ligase family protein n=1 Tax=Mycobacterium sp. DL592 TaxID=2675524 RepID=UPI00141EDC65|nr:O-antigen ligase family protein [Mycobacterium sp. DL592]